MIRVPRINFPNFGYAHPRHYSRRNLANRLRVALAFVLGRREA